MNENIEPTNEQKKPDRTKAKNKKVLFETINTTKTWRKHV